MQLFTTFAATLAAITASAYGAPTSDALPDGFEPITREEILRRLEITLA